MELPQVRLDTFVPAIRGKLEAAYRTAQSAPESAQASGQLGMLLHAHEQFSLAETCYRRAHLLEPGSFRWRYYLGTVLARQRKDALATGVFRDAAALKSEFVPLQLALAESLFLAGETAESEERYEAILLQDAGLPQAHLGLGRIFSSRGEAEQAAAHFEKACELAPRFAAARYALALAYRDAGRSEESAVQLALYAKDKSAGPALPDPLLRDVHRLKDSAPERVSRGVKLEAAGRIEEAIAEHERALELDPAIEQAHSNLLTLYARVGRLDKAEEHYHAAVEINRNQAELHYNFGVLLFENARYREAGQAFRLALDINPNYAEAHNNLGQVLENEGRLAEAMQHYRQAVANKPNYRLAHFHLGRMLVSQSRYEEAVASFEQTLMPTDERTPTFTYGLAAAYVHLGRSEEALRYGRRAAQLAASYGQHELAAKIRADLRKIEMPSDTQ